MRDIVAHAAGGMLVGHRTIEIGPIKHGATIAHGQGERNALGHGHVLKIDRHGEGGRLGMGHRAGGEAGYELGNVIGREDVAITLGEDDFLGEEDH